MRQILCDDEQGKDLFVVDVTEIDSCVVSALEFNTVLGEVYYGVGSSCKRVYK